MIYITKKITAYLYNQGMEIGDTDLFEYGMRAILRNLIIFLFSIFISIYLNILLEFLLFNFIFLVLRQLTGGYHAKSPITCFIGSVLLILVIPYVVTLFTYNAYELTCSMILSVGLLTLGLKIKPNKKYILLFALILCNILVHLLDFDLSNIIIAAEFFDLSFLVVKFLQK